MPKKDDNKFSLDSVLKEYELVDSKPIKQVYDTISTGSFNIDRATGVGGLVRGSLVEVFGHEGSSKTTMSLHSCADALKQGLKVAFIDTECKLDFKYAESLGVDMGKILYHQPKNIENCFDIIYALLNTGEFGIIVLDSLAQAPLTAELENKTGTSNMGKRAQNINSHSRKITYIAKKYNTLLMYLNQIRGAFDLFQTITTPGGYAIKHQGALRIQLNAGTKEKIGENDPFGHRVTATIVKNNYGPPNKKVQTLIRYGEGYDNYFDIIEVGIKRKLIAKSGSWLSLGKHRCQGMPQLRAYLMENPKTFEELKGKCGNDTK
jgi:recombination protein RecA